MNVCLFADSERLTANHRRSRPIRRRDLQYSTNQVLGSQSTSRTDTQVVKKSQFQQQC